MQVWPITHNNIDIVYRPLRNVVSPKNEFPRGNSTTIIKENIKYAILLNISILTKKKITHNYSEKLITK